MSPDGIVHRMGVGVRHAGNDGVSAFRIPGLVTTNKGTLLGVYDVRYNRSVDLQEHVDVGLSRSTDGGRTWEKMRFAFGFRRDSVALPAGQNGVGDPSILGRYKDKYMCGWSRRGHTVWVISGHGGVHSRVWI